MAVYTMARVDGYPFVFREDVRFRDLDGMGHVNNAVFLTYLEQARFHFLERVGLARVEDEPPLILARVEIDFRSPAGFGDDVEIGVRAGRIGTKSFELEYELRADDRLVGEGKSVLVGFDYTRGESVEIPGQWRKWFGAEVVV
jgi:acyl-CoA thioester hydrolase